MTDFCLPASNFVSLYTHPAMDTLPPGVAGYPGHTVLVLSLPAFFCLLIDDYCLRLTIELIYITGIYLIIVAYEHTPL